MPGIMPMKIIKVGTSSQSRVAQACDRCRSKKIRCDGITPCCSQCANVGFECKTSDKLSRRAFPRGYTESLEEKVRQLESEVRELKGLLDEKDEKIDLLSRFHDFSTRQRSEVATVSKTEGPTSESEADSSEHFNIKNPISLLRVSARCEPHWAGASSSTAFLDVFKEKAAATGRAVPPISPRSLFSVKGLAAKRPVGGHARRPPRLVSDRLVNVFFQEFAPLLPILYRPAFLQLYREFAEASESLENYHAVAQLNLVFDIASTASDFGRENGPAFVNHWQSALNAVIHDNSLATLQCLVLAQLCCLVKGDSNKVLHYTGIAVIMSRRLGLYRSQSTLALDALTTEMRKRVFWCMYTLDVFTAANLGLPRVIKDEIVQTEFPTDVDDDDLFEQRLTTNNQETKMSAGLAFFRLSRTFAQVIDNVYQKPTASGVSLNTIRQLSEDLDAWHESLAPHLRLVFAQDKPSTLVTGDRSPLLSLAYYHARALLYRPLATSELGAKAIAAVMALADASKHIVQIAQLLDERHMSFSLPLNKHEVLVNAGLGLLYQGLTIQDEKSCLVNDSQRLVCAVVSTLDNAAAPCSTDFKALACTLITVDVFARRRQSSLKDSISPRSSVSHVRRPLSAELGQLQHGRLPSVDGEQQPEHESLAQRRAQCPGKLYLQQNSTALFAHQQALMTVRAAAVTPKRSEPSLRKAATLSHEQRLMLATGTLSNLDYLHLGNTPPVSSAGLQVPKPVREHDIASTPWDRILGCLHDDDGAMPLAGHATARSPSMDVFGSGPHSGVDGSAAASAWQDPASATTWGTDASSVPSVFDDSGASFTSCEDRTSFDLSSASGKDLNVFTGIELASSLADDYATGLSCLDGGIAF